VSLDMQETGRHIRQYRKIAGLTQEELARKIGISTMSIRRYESGERIATLGMLQRIATTLNVPVQELVSDWSKVSTEDAIDLLVYGGQISRVAGNMQQLNLEGRKRVEAYSADMLQIAAYRAETDPQRPISTSEATDTTPPEKPAEGPQGGE